MGRPMDQRFEDEFSDNRDYYVRVAYRITKDTNDAEDAVQQAFGEKLLVADTGHLLDAAVKPYASTAVRNEALLILRRRHRRPIPLADPPEPVDEGENDLDLIDPKHWDACLREALAYLPKPYAEIIQILFQHDSAARALDALVAVAGKEPADDQEREKLRNTQKVRLRKARQKLEMLVKLCEIRRTLEAPRRTLEAPLGTLETLVEITLTGDCVYHELQWGLRHYPKLPDKPRGVLDNLVQLALWIHFALRDPEKPESKEDRHAIFAVLSPEAAPLRRLKYKNEKEKVRYTLTVFKNEKKAGKEISLEALRKEFHASHSALRERKERDRERL